VAIEATTPAVEQLSGAKTASLNSPAAKERLQ
jgi:hypothetical protein